MVIDTNLILTGDLLLTSGNSWLSKTIRFFTKSKWNHVGMFVKIEDKLFVAEQNRYNGGAGLILTDFNDYLNGNDKLLVRRPIFDVNEDEYQIFILNIVGKYKYDYKNLLYQIYHQITNKWPGTHQVERDNRLICSQLVGLIYHNFNKNLFRNYYELAPADFANDHKFFTLFKKD